MSVFVEAFNKLELCPDAEKSILYKLAGILYVAPDDVSVATAFSQVLGPSVLATILIWLNLFNILFPDS